MSHQSTSPAPARMPRRRVLASLLSAVGVMALPSCGGGGGAGGGVAGVDTGGTGSFFAGRITGFGSIIVNGVRFEDNAARVADDDGAALVADDLKIGMVVRVQAGAITPGSGDVLPSATATAIVVESQIKGRVESRTGTDTLVVFGQTVKLNAATVRAGTTFAAIAVGDVLEVSGFADAAGVITASRIEREADANEFRVRGAIANLTATTFQIGSATFSFAGSQLPAGGLANGLFVRVRTTTTQNASGQWVVTRIDLRAAIEDRDEAELEGILVQSGSVLQVGGVTIDTSRLVAGSVPAPGQKVEVEGRLVNGVLVASAIKLEDANEDALIDVRGTASAVDKVAQTFVVRGLSFHYTVGSTREDHGTIAADLANGANVRVRGSLPAPASGTGDIEASRIDFQP